MSLIYSTELVKIMCFDKVVLNVKENRFYSPTCSMNSDKYTIKINQQDNIVVTGKIMEVGDYLYTSALDSCYTHAIWDNMLIVYYILSKIQGTWMIDKSNVNFFIRDVDIVELPHMRLLLDEVSFKYKGMWQWLNNKLTDRPLIFQHLLADRGVDYVVFNKLYTKNHQTYKQITPWRNYVIAPNRIFDIPLSYTDEQRQVIIDQFKHFVNPRDFGSSKTGTKFIIINRQKKGNNVARVILDNVVKKTVNVMTSNGFEYTGMVHMEDMTLDDRIELFKQIDVVISPRSSCSANVLWMYDVDYISITLGDDKICNNEVSLFSYDKTVNYHHYIDDLSDTNHWDAPIYKMDESRFDRFIKDRLCCPVQAMPAVKISPFVGIIPAAGKASRISGLPKFLLPFFHNNKSTILLTSLVDMMNVDDLYVTTCPENAQLIYKYLPETSTLMVADTHTMSETVCRMQKLVGERNVLFGMPDTYVTDKFAYKKLADEMNRSNADVVVGLWKFREDQKGKLGQCQIDVDRNVVRVVDKDPTCDLEWAWGALAWKSSFWNHIDPKTSHVGYGLNPAIAAGLNVKAVYMEGEYYDCGTPSEYIKLLTS